MLVRDSGDVWQVVLQTDHADLSGQFARAWSPRPEPFRSLEIVARRHDDGWAVWERAPSLDGEGRPRNFLDVQVPSHLAFYRAAIAAVTDDDAYAGLILSMHGAGIYSGRYGTQPELEVTYADGVQELVDEFVAEQEAGYGARVVALGIAEHERWASYGLLQTWDRLSLYFGLRDLEAGTPDAIGSMPWNGSDTGLRIEPRGPWHVALEPFPFSESPAGFTLLRRLVPKKAWEGDDAFRADFAAVRPELVRIVAEPLL